MQGGATTVGQTEVASSPRHIRSAAIPASGSEVPNLRPMPINDGSYQRYS